MATSNEGQPQAQTQTQAQGGQGQDGGAPAFVIPEAFKAEKSLENVKDYDGLFKMAVEGQKALGRAILLPDEKDPDPIKQEKWGKVWSKLGRPDKEDGYELKEKPILPNGMEWKDEKIAAFRKAAHKLNLTNEQFAGVLNAYAEELGSIIPDIGAEKAKTAEKLAREMGENTFKRVLGEANAAVDILEQKAGFKNGEFSTWLRETGIGNNEYFVKIFGAIGREMVEHGSIDEGVLPGVKTAKDALAEARKIMGDKKDPYNDGRHPDHKERVKYVTELLSYEDAE